MPRSWDRRTPRPDRALLAFALAVLVFHHLPTLVGKTAADWVDLFTPLAVVGCAAALLLALRAPAEAFALALLAALLYVDGHGIHLAANSIGHERLHGSAKNVTHFWDEEWGHEEWHLGWFGLVGAFCVAERKRFVTLARPLAIASALCLGFTLFTSTVEGGTWWLELGATALLVPWAVAARRPLLATCAAAFALCALLIGIWAVWHGGVPQFSDLGWI